MDILAVPLIKAEIRKARTKPNPESSIKDLGMTILPSENLATAQKTIDITNPTTKSKPLEVSTGIFVKGKKKIGKSTITKKSDQKEILSKIFDNILF
jgi:hypothetical protein